MTTSLGARVIGISILLAGWIIFLGHLTVAKEVHLYNSIIFAVMELLGGAFFYPEKIKTALAIVATPLKDFWPYKGRDDEN